MDELVVNQGGEQSGISEGAIKKGAEIELTIDALALGGKGVARKNGFVIFVEGALPGQRVKARIYRKKTNYAEGRALQVVRQSPLVVSARCPHFGVCGGCLFQNLAYEAQLHHKRQQVLESLEHIGGFRNPPVGETLPSEELYYYRNKMEFSFGERRWITEAEIGNEALEKPKDFALGLHVRGRYDRVLDLETCFLQSHLSVEVLQSVREFTYRSGIRPYTTRDHTGFWRHLVIREGKNTGDFMVNVVTAEDPEKYPIVEDLAEQLRQRFPQITTIVHNINRKRSQVAEGDEERILYGPGKIHERLGRYVFQISANSFFQTNTKSAEKLYQRIVELAECQGDELVYDLYCGAGTISIFLSPKARTVVGFEVVGDAIRNAYENCRQNGITNCSFLQGDIKDEMARVGLLLARWGQPDLVVIDPPRAGMHPKVVKRILELHAPRLIYVSCNPATLARDLKELCARSYELKYVQPVDMFPHTVHCEVVTVLERTAGR